MSSPSRASIWWRIILPPITASIAWKILRGERFILRIKVKHPWHVTPRQAKQLQLRLRKHLSLRPSLKTIKLIAAADASFKNHSTRAAVAVFTYPQLELVEWQTASAKLNFPYVPGLLTFREGPVLIKAFLKLKSEPDLIIFDGQGYAHPQRFGIASHMGVIFDKPTIGSAKSRLIGEYREPSAAKGSFSRLKDRGEVIGAVLRTQDSVKPIYVSAGHKIDLKTALKIVKRCVTRYRLPDPIRFVHHLSNQWEK